jgi:hypothetical protein
MNDKETRDYITMQQALRRIAGITGIEFKHDYELALASVSEWADEALSKVEQIHELPGASTSTTPGTQPRL